MLFDAAAKYENFSLNDALTDRPDLLASLTSILLQFRK